MFAYDPAGLGYTCKKIAIALTEFQPVLEVKTSDVYIMMSREGTLPDNARKWYHAARTLKEDGTIGRIAEKWADRVYRETGIGCAVIDGVLTFSP